MTRATEKLRAVLGLGDPFADPPLETLPEDLQGWAGTDPLLRRAIEATRPGLVIEVGTWKGQSAVFMAEACRELGLDAARCASTPGSAASSIWSTIGSARCSGSAGVVPPSTSSSSPTSEPAASRPT